MITIHQRHRQTERQTDRQTTCDRNTELCTKVHRAVIKVSKLINLSLLFDKFPIKFYY